MKMSKKEVIEKFGVETYQSVGQIEKVKKILEELYKNYSDISSDIGNFEIEYIFQFSKTVKIKTEFDFLEANLINGKLVFKII